MPIVAALPLTMREGIRVGIERRKTDSQIGDRLGRHRCKFNAEINRNDGRDGYVAVAARLRADGERGQSKILRLVADPVLAAHVTTRLEAKDSPMTISTELARGVHDITASISHESIYRDVSAHGRRWLRRGFTGGAAAANTVRHQGSSRHGWPVGRVQPDRCAPQDR